MMAPDFCNLTEGMPQHLSVVIVDEDGVVGVVEQVLELLFVILRRVRPEQVRAYLMVHHIHLMQQGDDMLDVVTISFSYHKHS